MNYELAKELKDAKYPGWDLPEFMPPSLEELIEACGEDFDVLVRHETEWTADHIKQDGQIKSSPSGKTPSEAVARLWLALNK